mmetsp:Transcript_67619/g.214064  ORF Transcript_67619/g.214064 Transcript_67619/m.214064 type:complete len:224 (-) Transcript_67619:27-698(-)
MSLVLRNSRPVSAFPKDDGQLALFVIMQRGRLESITIPRRLLAAAATRAGSWSHLAPLLRQLASIFSSDVSPPEDLFSRAQYLSKPLKPASPAPVCALATWRLTLDRISASASLTSALNPACPARCRSRRLLPLPPLPPPKPSPPPASPPAAPPLVVFSPCAPGAYASAPPSSHADSLRRAPPRLCPKGLHGFPASPHTPARGSRYEGAAPSMPFFLAWIFPS